MAIDASRGLRALVCVVVAGGLLLGSLAASAADPPGSSAAAQTGIDGLVPPPPDLQQGNRPTLAERYPATAYVPFHVDTGSAIVNGFLDPAVGTTNVLFNMWAGEVMAVLLVVAVLASRLLEWTFSIDVITGAGTPLASVVHALAQQVYAPLLGVAVTLVGIWLTWHLLLRQRTMHGLQGGVWAIAAVVAAGAYFSAPVQVMSGLNGFTADLARSVLGAVSTADPRMVSRGADPSLSQGDPADAELRVFVDRYWRTFVFTPWSVAALGDVQSGQRYGEELLAKQAGQPSTFDDDIRNAPQSTQDWYAGKQGGQRLAIVTLALAVVIVASLLFLFIAGAVVIAQMGLLVLLMLAPLFLLVGIQPGMGRRLLVRWGELVAGALLLRILSSAFLAVLVVLSGIVTDVGAAAGWAVAAALQLALVVTGIVYRKPFLRVFGQVASPRLAPTMSHVSHSRPAEVVHGWLERRATVLRRVRPTSGGAASRSAAQPAPVATNRTGAGRPRVVLTAIEAGKLGVRTAARTTRRMQETATPFVLEGRRVSPPPPRFRRSTAPARPPASTSSRSGPTPARPRPATRPPAPSAPNTSTAPPAGARTYTNRRTGATVTVDSRIVLPYGWTQAGRQ